MSTRKVVEVVASDPVSRRIQTLTHEHDRLVLNTTYDAEPILEDAKIGRDHLWSGNYHKDGLGTRIATIPLTILVMLRQKGILQDRKALARWLNDNPGFKTVDGNPIG